MRYYEFSVKINEEVVFKASKKDAGYVENVLASMNHYLYKHAIGNMFSFAYSINNSISEMVFCFDEKQISYGAVIDNLDSMLSELDCNYKLVEPFTEITRFQFKDAMNESHRKEYLITRYKMTEFCRINFLEYDDDRRFVFNLQERIVPDIAPCVHTIYDQSVKNELDNISSHKDSINSNINLVHYIISAKKLKTIEEIATILTNRLFECHRLSSKRIEVISEINTHLYKKNHFEAIVEDSCGGTIILDMSSKLSDSSSAYVQTCEYLSSIIRKYKNKCLFIFANCTASPSYAYQLISRIEKDINLLPLKEGYGDKDAAKNYLKSLISSSDFSATTKSVNEYMKSFRNNSFSQSDILDSMDKFETWCINHAATDAYNFTATSEMLFGHENYISSPSKRLDEMIGLKEVKKQIHDIIAASVIDRERRQRRGLEYESRTMHMIFAGNPGTAKTTVAKLFGQIAKEHNLLKSGIFVEKSGANLFNSGESNISSAFEEAKGGILFIDEAYAIQGSLAITSLIQEMENHRDEVITIFAGYNDSMKAFLKKNDGLKSRIPYWINFPDYSVEELIDILKLMLRDRGFETTPEAISVAYNDFEKAVILENFGNGRYVRNYLEEIIKNQSARLYSGKKPIEKITEKNLFTLEACDFNPGYDVPVGKYGKTARETLDSMIGLESAKKILNKAIASFKMRKLYNEKGISTDKPTMHMVFTGNPGTAKTSTARLIAQILKDEHILSSGSFVEAGRSDLIGVFVGQTAQLVKEQFKKARGGVLFIDEAYSLCDSYKGYGDEAINTIVQEMENHREDVVVIFAGYPNEMKEFLERNPGMKSRIAFNVDFEDYSAEELCKITRLMISDKHMTITSDAMEKLRNIYDEVIKDKAYGNGRFVRQILEEASMNLAERLVTLDPALLSKKKLTTIEAIDIPTRNVNIQTKYKIGFAV